MQFTAHDKTKIQVGDFLVEVYPHLEKDTYCTHFKVTVIKAKETLI